MIAVEQVRHIGEWSSSHANVDHGSDQHPYHTLKKAIGLDRKAQPLIAGSLNPIRHVDAATVVRLVGLGRKAAEIVFSGYGLRCCMKQLHVDRPAQRPLIPGTKRGSGLGVEADVVAIPP
jgi:hypothetical protein